MNRLVLWLYVAFNVWMLVDAVRRRAELYWYLIMLLVPFGSVIYFFVVKVRAWDAKALPASKDPSRLEPGESKRVSAAARFELAAADRLEESEHYTEAMPLYREVLQEDPDNLRALHGLARCLCGVGEYAQAVGHYEHLLLIDNTYRDYAAALEYAEALASINREQDAVDLLRGLVRVAPRANHRLALAHYLKLAGNQDDARDELNALLNDERVAKDKNGLQWIERARAMLSDLEPSSDLH